MTNSASASSPSSVGPRLSAMMFLELFVWGAWYVSMTGFINAQHMSGVTAWAYSVGPVAAIISPLFLGLVADRFFATERVLGVMHILGGIVIFIAPSFASPFEGDGSPLFHPFVVALLVHMLCYMPTLGLTNTVAFHSLANRERGFPLVRVFGTIGWIVGNLVVSSLPGGDQSATQFRIAGAAGILLGFYSFTLPHTPPPAAGKPFSIREALGLDALKLLKDRSFAVFLVSSLLICIPLAAYYQQARNFVAAAGIADPVLKMSFGQMSEILFMLVMPLFFARLGVKWMLAVGMLTWVARYGLFAFAWDEKIQWMVIAGILLHGICYDFFFVTGQIYTDMKAPNDIRAQAQGFLVLVTQGLGLGIGAQVIGEIVARNTTVVGDATVVGWPAIWTAPSAMAAGILLLFVLLFRERGASRV